MADFNQNNMGNQQQGEYTQEDISKNKVMAIIAYLGILVIVPILAAKDSKFARFHANQGLILFIASVGYSIIYSILGSFLPTFLMMIISLCSLGLLVLAIIGIINAANGQAKELPLIGNFTILK